MNPSVAAFLILLLALRGGNAFSSTSSFAGNAAAVGSVANERQVTMEYIPDGISKDEWQKIKQKERNSNKNLGRVGITTFQSRSLTDWQKSGGKNLFPVDPKAVKNPKDLPYMMRPGGSADNSDLAKKNKGIFDLGAKKKNEEPAPTTKKQTNWWTLN